MTSKERIKCMKNNHIFLRRPQLCHCREPLVLDWLVGLLGVGSDRLHYRIGG